MPRGLSVQAMIAIGLFGGGGAPAISVSPAVWDFGSTPVGTPVSKIFTIENTGNAALVITLPITTDDGFTVTAQPASTSLAAGDSTTFTVQADAAARNIDSGNISIVSNAADSPTVIPVSARIGYLLYIDYAGLVEAAPITSPILGSIGRVVKAADPNSQFRLNEKLFLDVSASGANRDSYVAGQSNAGAAFPVVNGTFAIARVNVSASKFDFGLGTTIVGNPSPRFDSAENVGSTISINGIRTTGGTFNAVTETGYATTLLLWFLWTDKLYFGVNDKIIFAEATAPSGSKYPILVRTLVASAWNNIQLAYSNDFPNFLTSKTAPYTLSAGEYQEITDFLA